MFNKKKNQKFSNLVSDLESQADDDIQSVPRLPTVSASPRKSAVLGPTVSIKGEIISDENLLIEGKVEGTVTLNGTDLTIGPSGFVRANVTAKEIKIEGEVLGDISGNDLVIVSKTGKVHGNIIAPRVTLEDGANFKGNIDMEPTAQTYTEQPMKKEQPTETVKGLDKVKKVAADKEKNEVIAVR